ncbi:helix-turn-helix domain-containing protein [Salibacterium aidingense]|uniref:helix-turn-helix domain-containing protein n=1 Tax=Salibacterium aidingense TaxID=384933 RepID=UPI0003F5DA61|nr:helix-turn-helix domain-containing protein [Salibacterium aidingense]
MSNLSFRQQIFLLLAEKIDQERSIQSLYHIMTGKKSSQTIQDIKWYRLTNYFYIFPYWKESDFMKEAEELLRNHFFSTRDNRVCITEKGRRQNAVFLAGYEWPLLFNGWQYGRSGPVFWKRLALYVQCISHSLAGNRTFLPVFEDPGVQQWLKTVWPKNKNEKLAAAEEMFRELHNCLQWLSPLDAVLITYRLSGSGYTGLTFQQLTLLVQKDTDECYFRFQAAVHYLLEQAGYSKQLNRIAADLVQTSMLTNTTKKTLRYLNQNYSLYDIAFHRKLKTSTIEDHIVEIASEQADFPLEQYVSSQNQQLILYHSRRMQTMRLKAIKEAVQEEDIDYFSIRLTLAYYGGHHGNTR